MNLFLLQLSSRPNPRAVLQEYFSKPAWDAEAWTGVIIVVAAIGALALMLHFVMYYQKRLSTPPQFRSPRRLFNELLGQTDLNKAQRVLVSRMARDLRPPAPARILLSPKLFAQATHQWLASRQTDQQIHEDQLRQVAYKLFAST